MPEPPLRARGTSANPPNRYESLHLEPDEADAGDVPTQYYRDASRSVLAENDSPDVGFRFSLNPYRGCEHGCVYCLKPDTSVLHADMGWRRIGDVRVGDVIAGFDEFPRTVGPRRFRLTVVEAVRWSRRPAVRLVTEGGEIVTTEDHRWLEAWSGRWSRTDRLQPGRRLCRVPVVAEEPLDDDYRVGYLAGLSFGDGTCRLQPGWRSDRPDFPSACWQVALTDHEPLARTVEYLRCFAVGAEILPLREASVGRRLMRKVEIRSLPKLAIVHGLVTADRETRNYRRGFLAGFFDAEGHNGSSLRISQNETPVLERVRSYARSLGFEFALEPRTWKTGTLRLVGGFTDRMRFLAVCRPTIARKVQALFGRELCPDPDPVVSVERGPVIDVVDIQTSTRTFFAAGLATHNCYARPSHEYLGFSAGLDFERRIMVKEDAPALLRTALSSPRWEPQVVALSGNTDCYQPVERRLGITRRCLEVFAEFRNPVGVVTKSSLVARDGDLLGELATYDAAHVCCSITTLDAELARRMEPRAAQPAKRLEAIAALTAAGVPVAVLIGPVIPGLNDSEIPRILGAAAEAGARSATWVLLRLPKPVDSLFMRWLDEQFPDRKQRVLHRIQDTRSGRMSDTVFGRRKRGQGEYAAQIAALFDAAARKHGLHHPLPPLSAAAFRRPAVPGDQLKLL
jgi:DNA repair photolyase